MVLRSYPAAVVFDLDYTLWPCWCDTHVIAPFNVVSKREVVDRYGFSLSFYRDVESIILELAENDVVIIGASRTATPHIAKELLTLLHIGDKPAIKYFHSLQWGQGSKTKHISKAAKDLGLQSELKAGLFVLFDDEMRNRDVRSINCYFAHVEDENTGLTRRVFANGLKDWSTYLESSQAKV
ncbi:magnesium-dependent phosphatase-1 [Scheffersomyces xylosifermentans]|uniref:magnesium-dependent phosphatase-1 n=1 Tax=Scheffersomyces xylosifermentans TaxID=1304137 RepID=UPI00315CB9B8